MAGSGEPARVLIANRGEIACRIIRSCRALGLSPVAVYSQADAGAQHVEQADEAHFIGPARVSESYLSIEAVIAAARAAGAQAVHPGYGLLAENAAFAEAVTAAGLIWVGPNAQTIASLADKHVARQLAVAAGVPVLTGSGKVEALNGEHLRAAAMAVGFPLLIKATGGGGGIGMRVCESPDKLEKMAAAVSGQAERTFGDPGIFLEHYVARAHHVEVQVFGWGDGRVGHLFDRECSIQRRFQKVIEEAPAPCLDGVTRARIAEAACRMAAAQDYASAGTVEFIYDEATRDFYFLEMNTRIQVEHPATEMVTGEDLVARQLNLALGLGDGAAAPLADTWTGHAIECRLYAENPAKKFFPAPGTLEAFELPAASADVRVDTGFVPGDVITAFYDPLIAKVIVRGENRPAAVVAMRRALDDVCIEGVRHNTDYLKRVLEHPEFVAGATDTRFIERHHSALTA